MARNNVRSLGSINAATDLFDWEPFRGCSNCDGLCNTLQHHSVVEQLLRGEKVKLFEGSRDRIHNSAIHGCVFAKLLDQNPNIHEITYDLSLFLQCVDRGGPSTILLLSVLEGSRKVGELGVATVPDDPASSIVPTRPLNPDPVSAQNLRAMDEWLCRCNSKLRGHETCPKWEIRTSILPTRVINVVGDLPRLYTPSSGTTGQYAALSYCWGGYQPLSTTMARLAKYHSALPEALPATIQDAITLTHALGIPFLWVDSLCIVQDSILDKANEIAKMGQIYKNSWVTFAASLTPSCMDGFLHIQPAALDRLSHSVKIPIACPGGLIGNIILSPVRLRGTSTRRNRPPIDERAWIYQELLLSPRIISFYPDSIELECPRRRLTVDGLDADEQYLDPTMFNGRSRLRSLIFRPENQVAWQFPPASHSISNEPEDIRRLWNGIVSEYSAKRLTDPDDKLPAISALAAEFHRFLGDHYLAGLWEGNLIDSLLWTRFIEFPPSSQEPSYRIPTWSWASINDASIRPHSPWTDGVKSTNAKVLHYSVDLVSPEAPFSHVKGGELSVRGPLKRMSLRESWERFFWGRATNNFYDTKSIGIIWPDFRYALPKDASMQSMLGIPPDQESLFFLGLLSTRPEDTCETCGLVLIRTGDNQYERVGLFEVRTDLFPVIPSVQQLVAMDHWGDEYETRTISIQ